MKNKQNALIQEEQVLQLFPFHLVFNHDGKIMEAGETLLRLFPKIIGKKLHQHFALKMPTSGTIDFEKIIAGHKEFYLFQAVNKERFLLRGEIIYNPNSNKFLFLGFPWFHSIEEMSAMGVHSNEIGHIDPTFDYMNLLHTHEISLSDTLEIIEKNKEQKNEIEKLSVIAEESLNAITIVDKDAKIEWVNKAFEKLYGYSKDELIGQIPFQILTGPLTDWESSQKIAAAIQQNKSIVIDIIGYKKDGSHHWSKLHLQPIIDKSGNAVKYFSFEEDITEQKKIELELAENKQLLEFAIDAAGDGVWMVTYNQNFEPRYLYSDSYKRLLGYNKEDLFDDAIWLKSIDKKDLEELKKKYYTLSRTNPGLIHQFQIKDKSGHYKNIISRGKVIEFTAKGSPKKIIGTASDLTEITQLELESITTTKRLTNLLENLKSGILVEDQDRKIAIVNDTFCKLFSIPAKPSMLIGMDCKIASEQSKVMFENPDEFISDIDDKLAKKEIVTEQLLRLADGRTFSRDYIPIFHKQNYLGHLWQYTDITDRIEKEKRQQLLFEKEKELNEMKTRFIRITSHELRTPLAAVMTNAELLQLLLDKNGNNTCEKVDYNIYLNRVVKEVQRMSDTLSELIVVGRMEEGKEAFLFKNNNIAQYVKEIVADLFAPYSDNRMLTVDIAPDVQELVFCKRMLKHAFINVLSNAFKFSQGKKSPVLRLYYAEDRFIFQVTDFGIGIPKDEQDKVFSTFYRGSNTKGISGTGIGLMLTDYIVKAHNGTMTIKSKENVGTDFKISIPIHNNTFSETTCLE